MPSNAEKKKKESKDEIHYQWFVNTVESASSIFKPNVDSIISKSYLKPLYPGWQKGWQQSMSTDFIAKLQRYLLRLIKSHPISSLKKRVVSNNKEIRFKDVSGNNENKYMKNLEDLRTEIVQKGRTGAHAKGVRIFTLKNRLLTFQTLLKKYKQPNLEVGLALDNLKTFLESILDSFEGFDQEYFESIHQKETTQAMQLLKAKHNLAEQVRHSVNKKKIENGKNRNINNNNNNISEYPYIGTKSTNSFNINEEKRLFKIYILNLMVKTNIGNDKDKKDVLKKIINNFFKNYVRDIPFKREHIDMNKFLQHKYIEDNNLIDKNITHIEFLQIVCFLFLCIFKIEDDVKYLSCFSIFNNIIFEEHNTKVKDFVTYILSQKMKTNNNSDKDKIIYTRFPSEIYLLHKLNEYKITNKAKALEFLDLKEIGKKSRIDKVKKLWANGKAYMSGSQWVIMPEWVKDRSKKTGQYELTNKKTNKKVKEMEELSTRATEGLIKIMLEPSGILQQIKKQVSELRGKKNVVKSKNYGIMKFLPYNREPDLYFINREAFWSMFKKSWKDPEKQKKIIEKIGKDPILLQIQKQIKGLEPKKIYDTIKKHFFNKNQRLTSNQRV